MDKEPITQEGLNKLKEELIFLKEKKIKLKNFIFLIYQKKLPINVKKI